MLHLRIEYLIIIFIIQNLLIDCKRCGSKKNKSKPEINTLMEKKELRFLQSQVSWTPIKFYVDYTYLESQKTVDAKTVSFTKQVLNNTLAVFANLLMIQRTDPLIKVQSCFEDIPPQYINNQLKTTGISADIVIFPFFDITADELTQAYAAPCSLDPNTFRPIAGEVAFNPKNFIIDRPNALDFYTLLTLHEITHVLSFNSDLFEYFVDSNFKKIPITSIVQNITINNVSKHMIITPKVKAQAQNHFGCNSLQGVELEDQGGEGTAGSHWESRVMLGDFMIGEDYSENLISEITLALFEDSGWYKVNYYTAGLFRFGKNKGCDFVQKKCLNNQTSNFPNDFCTVPSGSMCFGSRTAKGTCTIENFKDVNIPVSYRYFSDPTKGGYTNADYCPVAKSSNDDINEYFFSTSCLNGIIEFPSLGETIGADSACFISDLVPKYLNSANFYGKNRAICHSILCNSKDETYNVSILNSTINCNKEGGVKTNITGFDGKFYCADYQTLCTRIANCSNSIDCVLKKVEYNFKKLDYIISPDINAPLSINDDSLSSSFNTAFCLKLSYIHIIIILIFVYLFFNN